MELFDRVEKNREENSSRRNVSKSRYKIFSWRAMFPWKSIREIHGGRSTVTKYTRRTRVYFFSLNYRGDISYFRSEIISQCNRVHEKLDVHVQREPIEMNFSRARVPRPFSTSIFSGTKARIKNCLFHLFFQVERPALRSDWLVPTLRYFCSNIAM